MKDTEDCCQKKLILIIMYNPAQFQLNNEKLFQQVLREALQDKEEV